MPAWPPIGPAGPSLLPPPPLLTVTGPMLEPASPRALPRLLWLFAAGLLALAAVGLSWAGFQQTDDLYYAEAAAGWAESGWFIADHHWGLRHMIVLPMALLFGLFGRSEFTLVAPMIGYVALLAVLVGMIAARVGGWLAALLAMLFTLALPVVATAASYVSTDVPEAVFVLASALLFHGALHRRHRGAALLAGICAGLAFITRETTLALVAFYGLLFLANYGRDRWAYVWLGAGFCLVAGIDTLFLWSGTGDPLYRIAVTRKGVDGDNPLTSTRVGDGFFNAFGVIEAPRWIQGPLMLFTSQAIGPLPWLAVPAAILVLRRSAATPEVGLLRYFGVLGLLWFVILNWLLVSLWVLPRYNIVPLAVLAICLGTALARLFAQRRIWLPAAGLGFVLLGDFALLASGGRDAIHGERSLARALRAYPAAMVRTDPSTRLAADWLLLLDGTARPASQGALHEALLRLHRVPILGLLQVGGDWDALGRRRDGLPWFPPLAEAAADPHELLSLLEVRRRRLHHAFMVSG